MRREQLAEVSYNPVYYNLMTIKNTLLLVCFIISTLVGFARSHGLSSIILVSEKKQTTHIAVKPSQKSKPIKVPIVIYHSVRPYIGSESQMQDTYDVTPELLASQVAYLKTHGFTTITFEALSNYFDYNTPLPVKPIILSFDDSWENQYKYAFPVLKKENVIGTFFVFTNSLGVKHHLTWSETLEMKNAGMEIGSHTKHHPYLDLIASPALLSDEVSGSKKILETKIGTTTTFAYPFGERATSSVDAVRAAGYKTARAIRAGNEQTIEERLILRGFIVSDSLEDFIRKVNK